MNFDVNPYFNYYNQSEMNVFAKQIEYLIILKKKKQMKAMLMFKIPYEKKNISTLTEGVVASVLSAVWPLPLAFNTWLSFEELGGWLPSSVLLPDSTSSVLEFEDLLGLLKKSISEIKTTYRKWRF